MASTQQDDFGEPMIKGYILQNTGKFIATDPEVSRLADPLMIEEILALGPQIKPTAWYPRRDLVRLFRAIADGQPDETGAYEALVRCGQFSGAEAINTFMRLLFRILTPRMFATKFPDFFKRDHLEGGEGVVEEISNKRLILVAKNIAGYDHFGPNTVGFASVGLGAMGLQNLKMTCSPWSLAEPGPTETRFIATWE